LAITDLDAYTKKNVANKNGHKSGRFLPMPSGEAAFRCKAAGAGKQDT